MNNPQKKNKVEGFKKFLISPLGKVTMIVVLYILIFLLIYFAAMAVGGVGAIIISALFIYFGWQALSRITPNFFLIMPVGKWVAYYVIKGFIAFFLGLFVAPFVIAKKVSKSITEKYLI